MSDEVFQFARHYHTLFAALCRSKQSSLRHFRCHFCSAAERCELPVNQFLRHYRMHPHNREACLVCGQSFYNRTLSYVYTHFSLCLLPDRAPIDRKHLPVDRALMAERRPTVASATATATASATPGTSRDTAARTKPTAVASYTSEAVLRLRWQPLLDVSQAKREVGDQQDVCDEDDEAARPPPTCAAPPVVSDTCNSDTCSSTDAISSLYDEMDRDLLDQLSLDRLSDSGYASSTSGVARGVSSAIAGFTVTAAAIRSDAPRRLVRSSAAGASPTATVNAADQQQDLYFRPDAAMSVQSVQPDYLRPSDEPHSLGCYACDCQRERYTDYFCDRWPDNQVRDFDVSPTIGFDKERLLRSFLANRVFRQQYHCVPRWLRDAALPTPDDRAERLSFNDTGVSSVMAKLLTHAYQSQHIVLRHLYIYEFHAQQILDALLNSTQDVYVFPFSCLCSGNCFNDLSQEDLLDELIDTLTPAINRSNSYAPLPEDRLCLAILAQVKRLLAEDRAKKKRAAATSSTATTPTDAADLLVDGDSDQAHSTTDGRFTLRARRAHRSSTVNQQRVDLFLELLRYLRDTFAAGQRRLVNSHRHVIACFRTEAVWRSFTAAYCHRFINTAQVFRLPHPELTEAYQYLCDHPFATCYSNRLQNLAHVFNTVAYVSRPTQSLRQFNFYRTLVRLRDMQASWLAFEEVLATTDSDAAHDAAIDAQRKVVRAFARRLLCPSRASLGKGSKCSHNGGLRAFGRVARFFLYERWAGFSSFTMRHLYRLFVHCSWQPKSWESDHFYIATPLVDHGLLMYWSLVDGCLAQQLNLVLTNLDFKSRHEEVSSLLFRVNDQQFYTRLGYIFPYTLSQYPLEHRLPLCANTQAAVRRLRGCSVGIELRERKAYELQQQPAILGDLFDLVVFLSPAAVNRFVKQLLASRNVAIIKTS